MNTREIKKLSNKELVNIISSTLDTDLLYELEEEYINRQVGYVPEEEVDDESL